MVVDVTYPNKNIQKANSRIYIYIPCKKVSIIRGTEEEVEEVKGLEGVEGGGEGERRDSKIKLSSTYKNSVPWISHHDSPFFLALHFAHINLVLFVSYKIKLKK